MKCNFYVIRFQDAGGKQQYLTRTKDGSPRITNNILHAVRFKQKKTAQEQGAVDDYWNAGLPVKKAFVVQVRLDLTQVKVMEL